MSDNDRVTDLKLTELEAPEVGDQVEVTTPAGAIRATWLGKVGTGPGAMSLTEACQMMNEMAAERQAQQGG